MNIFYLDHNPTKCAEMHVDKHCVKMILEYAQLLSTAHRVLDGTEVIGVSKTGRKAKRWQLNDHRESALYSATHINHPSAVWVRQSKENYKWLSVMLKELCKEYTHRYGKFHKCEETNLVLQLLFYPNNIPSGKFTEPTPAMPDQYKVAGNSIESYKNYYLGEKTRMFSWKKREVPSWINTIVT